MAVLVTGGAGYVGSNVATWLIERGEDVCIVDNLTTGYRQAAPAELIVQDIRDSAGMEALLRERGIDAVLHFAGKTQVGESVGKPHLYYDNNVGGSLSLLRAMAAAGVGRIVFSSTAAVYGAAETMPITEDMPTNPVNPYGHSKLMVERILRDFGVAHGIRAICLRYFNVAGAHPSGRIGEAHDPESHIIPNILKNLLTPERPFVLYGTDYPTRDGTCVRDYVEINDLADAHLLALDALRDGHAGGSFNLSSGEGFSNREIIAAVERATGRTVEVSEAGRRPGDPPTLIASSEKFRREMGWNPERTNLATIIEGAWRWHSGHPRGYGDAARG